MKSISAGDYREFVHAALHSLRVNVYDFLRIQLQVVTQQSLTRVFPEKQQYLAVGRPAWAHWPPALSCLRPSDRRC